MAIAVDCPHCGKSLRVKEELAGKSGKCPQCQQTILVPAAAAALVAAGPPEAPIAFPAEPPTTPVARKQPTSLPASAARPAGAVLGPEQIRAQVLAAVHGQMTPPRVGLGGKLAGLFVLLVMLLMPLFYAAVIGGLVYGMYWLGVSSFGRGLSPLIFWAAEVLGGLVLICLLKPLVEPRRRSVKTFAVALDNEGLFREFLAQICQQLDAPVPSVVRVECSPRLSADFRRGRFGLPTGGVALTIGLPLAACLSVDQLAGVLAGQLALLRRRSGSHATQLIRCINEWLWRSIYARSRFDQWLALVAERPQFQLAKLLLPLRGAKFIAQAALFVPMFIANTVAAGVVRRTELDADRAAARLVGRRTFTSLLERLEQIEFTWEGVVAELDFLHREQQLPDNLPQQLALRMLDMTPELCAALRETVNPPDEKPFDSRPSSDERLAAIAGEAADGVLRCQLPARALLSGYDELARKMTWDYYVELFGAQLLKTATKPVVMPAASVERR